MVRESLEKVMREYPAFDVKQVYPFANSPIAHFIRHELPDAFAQEFADFPQLNWVASPGKGKWADTPWIAALNPLVTDSPQEGYYPVLLFSSSLDRVFLSLNQGYSKLREQVSDDLAAANTLRHRADLLKMRLHPHYETSGFTTDPINLQPRSSNTQIAHYEPGHALGICYRRGKIPGENVLRSDIAKMLRLYAIAFSAGGVNEFDDEQIPLDGISLQQTTLEADRTNLLRQHRAIEQTPSLAAEAKRLHGYTCQVCGFDFEQHYGAIGQSFIEAHHKLPLAQLPKDSFLLPVPKDDFVVVCSNCHNMLHRQGTTLSFEEFLQAHLGKRPSSDTSGTI